MVDIISYDASFPTSSSQSINRVIPDSPANIRLAQFTLEGITQNTDFVELIATVGIRATTLNPTVLFKIFRGSGVIFSTRTTAQVSVGEFQTVSFQAIDANPPPGNQLYFVTAELINIIPLVNQANVVGPVSFSGKALANVAP